MMRCICGAELLPGMNDLCYACARAVHDAIYGPDLHEIGNAFGVRDTIKDDDELEDVLY